MEKRVRSRVLGVCVAGGVLAMAGFGTVNANPVSLDLFTANAPNAFGGPSFPGWWDNAQTAARQGLSTVGSAGPEQYRRLAGTGEVSSMRPMYEAVATSFRSWEGIADNPAHPNEHGHRMHWVYHVSTTDPVNRPLSLANIGGIDVLEDGFGDTGFSIFTWFFGAPIDFDNTTEFDPIRRVGYASDGTRVESGTAEAWDAANPGNEIVEIIGTFGMAYASSSDPDGILTDQERLDSLISLLEANLQNWHGTLTFDDGIDAITVTSTATFIPLPVPAAMTLAGLLAVACVRRRPAE